MSLIRDIAGMRKVMQIGCTATTCNEERIA